MPHHPRAGAVLRPEGRGLGLRLPAKEAPTEAASIQAPAEFLDNLPQIVDVLLDDPARIL